eukprot:SAG31_NODE_173_length_21354_cov_16.826112_8_plen_233_part_00
MDGGGGGFGWRVGDSGRSLIGRAAPRAGAQGFGARRTRRAPRAPPPCGPRWRWWVVGVALGGGRELTLLHERVVPHDFAAQPVHGLPGLPEHEADVARHLRQHGGHPARATAALAQPARVLARTSTSTGGGGGGGGEIGEGGGRGGGGGKGAAGGGRAGAAADLCWRGGGSACCRFNMFGYLYKNILYIPEICSSITPPMPKPPAPRLPPLRRAAGALPGGLARPLNLATSS